jgi:PPM family protein phosphatase
MSKSDRLETCAETRTGSRNVNEDSCVVVEGSDLASSVLGLIAVADGIGGLGSGHVASSSALTTVSDTFRRLTATHTSGAPPIHDWLSFCFHKANSDVLRMSLVLPELKGMGTTCTCAAVTPSHVYLCHVGDSRAYLWHEGVLSQLTKDEWFNGLRQPEKKPGKAVTIVNQAIGWQPMISPIKSVEPIGAGDIILLCTDGLTDSLTTAEIEHNLAGDDLGRACRDLADQASGKAGADNVTVILARL